MRIPIRLLGALVAVITVFVVGLQSAYADSGGITIKVYKAGWFIGGSGGGGSFTFHGRTADGSHGTSRVPFRRRG